MGGVVVGGRVVEATGPGRSRAPRRSTRTGWCQSPPRHKWRRARASAGASATLRGAACLVSSPQDTAGVAGRRSRPAQGYTPEGQMPELPDIEIYQGSTLLTYRGARAHRSASGRPVSGPDRDTRSARRRRPPGHGRRTDGQALDHLPRHRSLPGLALDGRRSVALEEAGCAHSSRLRAGCFRLPHGDAHPHRSGVEAAGGAACPLRIRGPGEARSGWPGGDRFDLPRLRSGAAA